jgi:glycerophosphoryl diester phosphodiesterase
VKSVIWKVAHRGASGEAPENTIISFQRAIAQGADVIETDARLSKDKEIVLIHDETVERTTDGRDKVSQLTLKEIKSLDAGSWFGKEFSGEKIPTLSEALEVIRGRTKLNIEFKGKDPLLVPKVTNFLKDEGFIKEAILSSFDYSFIEEAKRLERRVTTGLLFATPAQRGTSFPYWKWADLILPRYNLVSEDLVKRAHSKSLKVIVWTVDEPEEIKRLSDLRVDGIASNYPALLTEVLTKSNK